MLELKFVFYLWGSILLIAGIFTTVDSGAGYYYYPSWIKKWGKSLLFSGLSLSFFIVAALLPK